MPKWHIFFCFLCNGFLFFPHLYYNDKKEVTFLKNLIILLLTLCLFCSCGTNALPEKEIEPDPEIIEPAPEIIQNETEKSSEQAKIILALPHHLDESYLNLSAGDPIGRRVDILFAPPENYDIETEKVINIEIPPELEAEIKADYPDFENSGNWQTTLTYYSSGLSAGIIKIIYVIGDKIVTDKAIICRIENGKIVRINYTNMEYSADEADLLSRVENFKNTTLQTKKVFEEGELFLEEETTYRYCFPADKLIYCYQLYFYEDTSLGAVINNDYFSEYFID